jgi:ribonuclease HII
VAVIDESDVQRLPDGVKDSKQVTSIRREMLYLKLCAASLDIGIGHAWPWEIDTMGPLSALQFSYQRALEDLKHKPELLYVDGTDGTNKVRSWPGRQIVEAKADAKYKIVSVASIVAKVFRDNLMAQEGKNFPQYNWGSNKGYGTPDHRDAIDKHGLLVNYERRELYLHRKRYCQRFLNGVSR